MVRRRDDGDDAPQVLDRPQPQPARRGVEVPPRTFVPDEQDDHRPDGEHHEAAEERAGFLRRNRWLLALATIAFALIAAAGYLYWDYARRFESTDDAFIQSRQFAIAPKVAGYLIAVPVTDNQHVATGDVIARIDPRDYQAALAQAEAQVNAAQAGIRSIDAQIAVQQAQIAAAQAQVARAQATVKYSEEDAARYRDLAQHGAGSVQQAQQTQSKLQQDQASLKDSQAALTVAERQVQSLQAQRANAEASLAQAEAQHRQAELNLGYTTITAAQAGRVVNLSAAVGEFVQAGTSLAMFVPDELWMVANFKETQLDLMRPGQPVTISIDAYPGRVVHGHVASVQPGSGTAFSLLPAENATGNYVKIVQRVPVKLVLDNPPTDVTLGPGMSVVPSVRVRADRSLYEKLFGQQA
ncbi:MAG: HlyD family secretion protein [Alphaproteobacteria bacterium]|nr:HlyD family secretion protein [Alphaproteobacteria bacterium]